MTPQIVRFSSHPHPFQVVVDRCTNPDCACADITFFLTEKFEDPVLAGGAAELAIRIDPETWQERAGANRPAAMTAIAAEFLRDFPEAEKKAFAELARRKNETARRMRTYRFKRADMDKGVLIAFTQIASEHGSITAGGTSASYSLLHDGRQYLVEDKYCTHPLCQCNEVHLEFMEYKPGCGPDGKDLVKDAFIAVLSLEGILTIRDAFTHTRDEALKVAWAWQAEFGSAIELLKWRYEKVREIARRSMPPARNQRGGSARLANDWSVVSALSSDAAPGRNDPCPCGSGRKFKRCCGAGGAVRAAKSARESNGKTGNERRARAVE